MLEIFTFIDKVKAQDLPNITDINLGILNPHFDSIEGIVLGVLNWVFILAGGLLLIAVVYSGILYITAGGDATKAENGKKNLIWALIGLVIMVLAVVIIGWVQDIINTNATF